MAKDLLVSWLNDAYAMEESQIEMLERFVKDFEDDPDIVDRLEEHLEESDEQKEQIRAYLENLDSSVSKTKSVLGNIMGAAQGMSTSMRHDTLVHDLLMLHAGEHYEHAAYMSLSIAAQTLGEEEMASTFMSIADEERLMAEWAEQQLSAIIRATLTEAQESETEDNGIFS